MSITHVLIWFACIATATALSVASPAVVAPRAVVTPSSSQQEKIDDNGQNSDDDGIRGPILPPNSRFDAMIEIDKERRRSSDEHLDKREEWLKTRIISRFDLTNCKN